MNPLYTNLRNMVNRYNTIDCNLTILINGNSYSIIEFDQDYSDRQLCLIIDVEGEQITDNIFMATKFYINIDSIDDIHEWFDKISLT